MASVTVPLIRRRHLNLAGLAHWSILCLVFVLVAYPLVLIMVSSFQLAQPGQSAVYSLDPWRHAFSDPALLNAIWNTFTLTLTRQAIAFPIAILLAWILARTDIPGSHWIEFLFWIAFFLPSLPVTLGWIMLLDGQYGLINRLIASLPFVNKAPFEIYSFWGIVWAYLGTTTIAVKVMLLTPAFRNMDASLEEAARVCGSSAIGTLWGVVVPVMTPTLVVVLLLSTIHSLQGFEIELILGLPIRFFVFSTQIYMYVNQEPPLFSAATALSSMMLGLIAPLIVLQRWFIMQRQYTTVTGHFKGHKMELRRWRLPIFFLVLAVALTITLLPVFFLVVGTFMRLFGFFNLPDPWTTVHWSRVINDPIFLSSLRNTLVLAVGSALLGVVLYTLIAYMVIRTRFVGRSVLDFVSWLPSTLPGIILALGFLWLFLGTPGLVVLYGTIIALILSIFVNSMPLGVQMIKANLAQLATDLEEASWVVGGSWGYTFRRVILPIITPTLVLVGTVAFVSAARNVANIAILATSITRPLSLLQLDYMIEGRYEAGAVVGVIVVMLTTGIALVARAFQLRVGLGQGK